MPLTAFAKEISGCESLLVAPTSFDFEISDLEGLYLEIIQDAIVLQSSEHPSERATETFVKKKATFLNDLGSVLYRLRYLKTSDYPASANLSELSHMLQSLGIPLSMYSLKMNNEGYAWFVDPPKKIKVDRNSQVLETPSKTYGFVTYSPKTQADILPAGLKRSIGFAPVRLSSAEMPERQGGRIGFVGRQTLDGEWILAVGDFEREETFEVSLRILSASGFNTEARSFELNFNPRGGGWYVDYKNKLNPEGRIGF